VVSGYSIYFAIQYYLYRSLVSQFSLIDVYQGELEYQFPGYFIKKEVINIPDKVSYKAQQACMDLNSFFDKEGKVTEEVEN